ncbi:hypothetical protein EMM73_15195 [Rheinheimera sediminis]|uniref:hypothetical protein n=1 Tax=Rheinheimera sp. YQF-1 TaxID=2499626 RepID=UPI000FDAE19A|nr:hypothetical protein [Rheinheimera sp. YQF-1]RVT44835.1 hypothetical protein EMM73_15195 [Rheinheimera sp. YQF-1]
MNIKRYVNAWLILSIAAVLTGFYVHYVFVVDDGEVPSKADLATVRGQLNDFEIKNNGIRLEIDGFDPVFILKTRTNSSKVVSVLENSKSNSIYTILIDESEKECKQKLDYACSIWGLEIDGVSVLEYDLAVKQAQGNINRIDILSRILIAIGIIGTVVLALLRVRLRKIK